MEIYFIVFHSLFSFVMLHSLVAVNQIVSSLANSLFTSFTYFKLLFNIFLEYYQPQDHKIHQKELGACRDNKICTKEADH